MVKSFSNITSEGYRIQLDLYGAQLPADAPSVLYLHGFKGFKDWGFVPYLGERLVAEGMKFLAFNFSHNGIGAIKDEFTELDRFRENTFSLELRQAKEVIRWHAGGELFGNEAGSPLGLLGHSRGGGLALLAGSSSPDVQCVCTWAAVSTFKRYPQDVIDRWKERGVLEVTNARTGQVMELGWNLHADLLEHLNGKLNIQLAVSRMRKPLCIIHGTEDEAVGVADARFIFEWANESPAEVHYVDGAGHTFGAKHPFAGTTTHLEMAIDHTIAFFRNQFPSVKPGS